MYQIHVRVWYKVFVIDHDHWLIVRLFVENVDKNLMLLYDHFRFVHWFDGVLDFQFEEILYVMLLVEDRFVNEIYRIVNLECDGWEFRLFLLRNVELMYELYRILKRDSKRMKNERVVNGKIWILITKNQILIRSERCLFNLNNTIYQAICLRRLPNL